MERILLDPVSRLFQRWGNAGAVSNARSELVASHGRVVAAAVVARHVAATDQMHAAHASVPQPVVVARRAA